MKMVECAIKKLEEIIEKDNNGSKACCYGAVGINLDSNSCYQSLSSRDRALLVFTLKTSRYVCRLKYTLQVLK